jgi:phage regulator Rha-like protein
VKGEPVILDRDVAEIYGVKTREINQAVKNNPKKFPDGCIVELTAQETNSLRSKFLTLESGKGEHNKYGAKAFTEKALYMLATILKGDRATAMTLQIIDTFTELRQIVGNLDNAGNAKTNNSLSDYLATAATRLSNLLIKNMEADSNTVKTTLELNLGIARAKIETTQSKEKKIKNNSVIPK